MSQTAQVIELLTATNGAFIHDEALAASGTAIVPGILLAINAAGEVLEHATADGATQKAIALKNIPVADDIDDAYAVGETVSYGFAHSGQIAYMILADSNIATRLTALVSNGDGTLKINAAAAGATEEGAIVGYPVEPVTTSGAIARIKVRIA